jgi:hypothetical protein
VRIRRIKKGGRAINNKNENKKRKKNEENEE